jgi:hypothetical protein
MSLIPLSLLPIRQPILLDRLGSLPHSLPYEGQKVVELKHKNHRVGEGYPDLVVHFGREKMVVELKAVGGEMGAGEEQ